MTSRLKPITFLFAGLFILNGTGQAFFLPALPDVTAHFQISHDLGRLIFPTFLVGVFVSQLFMGFLSDVIGRLNVLRSLVGLYVIGCLITAIAPSTEILFLGMFVSGMGLGSVFALNQAAMTEFYPREEVAQKIGMISFSVTWVTALGALVGGYLTHHFSWQYPFLVIGAYALLLFVFLCLSGRGDQKTSQPETPKISYRAAYKLLISKRAFWGFALAFALVYSGQAVFYSISPFIMIHEYNISPKLYGALMFLPILGLMAGRLISGLAKDRDHLQMIFLGLPLLFLGGLLMLATEFFVIFPAVMLMFSMGIYLAGQGMISPNSRAGSMAIDPQLAGTASTLVSLIGSVVAIASTAIMGQFFHTHLEWGLLGLASLAAIAVLLLLKKPSSSRT